MSSPEVAFLHAITSNRQDDTARLVYAEAGERDRAAYLRLQVELVRTWWYDNPCTELYARLAQLAKRLDKTWLATVRRCTTPAPLINVAEVFPAFRDHAKTAVRLHPRPGEAPVDASKIGGMFLWPKREPWPMCPTHDVPYVTALQLRKEDVPELGFPEGTDLFQLLWCPKSHEESYCPQPAIFWRPRTSGSELRKKPPKWKQHWDLYDEEMDALPKPCFVYPERVIEYDYFASEEDWQLPVFRDALAVAKRLPAEHGNPLENTENLHRCWHCLSRGDKVGGHPSWNHHHGSYPRCECGSEMEYCLTFASSGFGSATWGRWVPIEDRPALETEDRERERIGDPHGCWFGRGDNMNVYICRKHSESTVRASLD